MVNLYNNNLYNKMFTLYIIQLLKNIYNYDIIKEYDEETKTLYYYANKTLTKIPKNTEIIIFGARFNQIIDNLPKSLTHLTFGYFFDKRVDNLPQSITHLTFGECFNQKVDNLPQSLIHLTFGYEFNQKVDNLPQSLTHLTFGSYFNQKVNNLPQSLTHLTFGSCFNQKVDNLPQSLTHLTFGSYFNQKVDNLPKNLTHLNFYSINLNKSINFLPKTLINFHIAWFINCDIIISKNIKNLFLTCNNNLINNIPYNIEKLHIYFSENDNFNKKVENLPITLKEIIIDKERFKQYIKIPFGTVLTIKNFTQK